MAKASLVVLIDKVLDEQHRMAELIQRIDSTVAGLAKQQAKTARRLQKLGATVAKLQGPAP